MAKNKNTQLIVAWVSGGVLLLLGMWILANLEMNIGVNAFSYVFALIVSLVLFLLAGLLWISVAVATRQHH
jgi:hypothetical protein